MKIRTDFVTNSSSSNYIVSFELISDQKESAYSGLITACADGDPGRSLAASVSYEGELPSISKDCTIGELCEMLFKGIIIKNSYYDNTKSVQESDEDYEDVEWNDDLQPRDYNAKELYPDLLDSIKEECKKKGIIRSNLDKIVIREDVYATGDDPIWEDALDEEYGGEKYKVSVYSANENCWQTITLIEGEKRNSGFRVLDQQSASYKTLSPEDLEMTEKEYKLLSIEKAAEEWVEKLGIYRSTASEKANLSTIHFYCNKEDANIIMTDFENIFAAEWKPIVEKKKGIYEGCNAEYNPLTCIITKDGFDAVIDIPLVPYIGEYYCESEIGEDPLDCAIERFKSSYPNISFNGHIKYVASLAYYFKGKVRTGMGESANYDVNSDSEN